MTYPHPMDDTTGFDAPEVEVTCSNCDGSGVIGRRVSVYENGCGFPHDDTHEEPCPECNGAGFFIEEAC